LLVLVLIAFVAVRVRLQVTNVASAIVPEPRLTLRTFVELFSETLLKLMGGVMGAKNARRFFPLIGGCAMFILFSNLMGLIPGLPAPTSNYNTSLACAFIVVFATHFIGVREQGLAYFKHFLGPILKWYALPLMILMVIIETISHLSRLVSLSVRLTLNMFADHLVVASFFSLIPLVIPLPFMVLGLLVCIVQTLVFSLLAVVYISMALGHESH
jgi:F-type H+-transporting ATPase subunit a